MKKEISKAYEPQQYEDKIYQLWEESGFFNPDNLIGDPYSIMMPPPNVTGILHLGHALENVLMDVMIRYQRMQGKKALLLPGTDHAAVATQAKVEKLLVEQGIKNPRQELGREKLLEKIKEYAENSKKTILKQIKKMGTSCDWSRLAYTFDEDRNKAVNTVFEKMYNDGLIYRGYRVINWSIKGQSTCSDDELVYIDRKAKLYTFKYTKDFPFAIATTRPETKLGDTAVAVNPQDKRYAKYIGKTFEVKGFGGSVNLKLKIIAEDEVNMQYGTGSLGVTPAHSSVDFEMYEKRKNTTDRIELIEVIGKDGKITNNIFGYKNLKSLEAREKVVKWLKSEGLLVKEEEIDQNVGTSDRFGDVVESIPMTQWFVAVNKKIPGRNKTLKELTKEAVEVGHKGDIKQKINLIPESQFKRHKQRIDELHDWCISRQIWWGHRIPMWYKDNQTMFSIELPGEGWEQDPDTLDTWFSAGMWTFSTLGWPDKNIQEFYPTAWMQMGHEILFLWFQRMVMMSTYVLDEIPFKDVYIHGILRDKDGKKFSKSANNGIDPLDVIKDYGCDALRISLISGISPGNDSRFYMEKVESSRNLVNKIWNISRFILMNINNPKPEVSYPIIKTKADEWILNELNKTIKIVTDNFKKYNFSYASEILREFTWNELADWYLEVAKIEGEKSEILNYILNTLLKLWHPFIPFVTESIWQEVYRKNYLLIQKWPKGKNDKKDSDFDKIRNIVINIRSLRADYKIDPAKKLKVVINAGEQIKLVEQNSQVMKFLARLEDIKIETKMAKPEESIGFVEYGIEVFIDTQGIIDLNKEKERISNEIKSLKKYIDSLNRKLSNSAFIENAPKEIIDKENIKFKEAKIKLEKLTKQFI